ncbi:MAG: hypothetical protein QOG15_1302 [Solirubrobacteraceae bacterium]|nr:hypothetical protein [Solirubrobacteraceae bacterium]
MSTVWIVSLAFAWVVIGLLTACVVTLLRQVGELRGRVDAGGAEDAVTPPSGPRLYDAVDRVELPVLGARGVTIAIGGEDGGPALLAVHAPGCSSCADLEEALETVARERPDITVVSVVALARGAAAKHVAGRASRGLRSVAVEDLPEDLVPDGLPAMVAIAAEGVVAAVGAPDVIDHLREAADVATGAVLIAGPDSMRETDWGRAVPAWGVEGASLGVLHVDGGRDER